MPRGYKQNGTDSDHLIDQLAARVQERIILFSAETGISADWVATRLSELLSPPGARIQHSMPELPEEAAGVRRAVEPLALAQHAHRVLAPPTIEAGRGTSENGKRTRVNPWEGMTAEERRAEHLRRMKKWSPEAKAKWRSTAPKGKVPLTAQQKAIKHRIYNLRAKAKQRGEPMPPLPDFSKPLPKSLLKLLGSTASTPTAQISKKSMDGYWGSMTPEQRRKEMAKRKKVTMAKREALRRQVARQPDQVEQQVGVN